eukprot:CAMPEP_0174712496 /NCGR_PEP_ID=MMETSP1094-20130205/13473_1 /TAXON_ID=156173 /ORGANISM="Chrysochromulina brevifilum, Strain UTEX LB 985" /LENGTH=57 /DNA_ID=CAMNT_0015911571 /DNA_START=306 /DNA_END=479 /DNA_ORIENTATION=-
MAAIVLLGTRRLVTRCCQWGGMGGGRAALWLVSHGSSSAARLPSLGSAALLLNNCSY